MTADAVDRRLLLALERDGRVTVKALADELHMSRSTVRSRLDGLEAREAFRVIGLVDPGYLGRPVVAVFFIRTAAHPVSVLEELWAMSEVSWAATMTDASTILVQGAFENLAAVARFVDDRLRSRTDLLREVDTHIVTAVYNPPRSQRSPEPVAWYRAMAPESLKDLDLAVVRALQDDGRIPFAHLAARIGLSVPAARQRVLRLIGSGIVQIRTIVDPAEFDLTRVAVLGIQVDGQSTRAARAIMDMEGLNYLDQTLGRYAILAEFHCADDQALSTRRHEVENLDGVRSADLFVMDRVPVFGGSWVPRPQTDHLSQAHTGLSRPG